MFSIRLVFLILIDFFPVKESKQSEEDKELIYQLSEQVGITTSLNLELTSKLKLSEGEIESYKKILVDYQNEISEMKVKHLNEASEVVIVKFLGCHSDGH